MENKDILKRTLIISGIIIFIDQILKLIISIICKDSNFEIIKNIFCFTKIENTGVAFSLNQGNFKNIIISSVIIVFIIKYLFTNQKFLNPITVISLDFIIGGGISNLIDRIFRGGVLDFIKISTFPIFNIADIFVVLGWGMYAYYIIKFEIKRK